MPVKKKKAGPTQRVRRSRHQNTDEEVDGDCGDYDDYGDAAEGLEAVVGRMKPVGMDEEGLDEGVDTAALPSLPRPTKPMTVDEYAKYLQAEMQLEDVVLERAAAIKANLAKLKLPAVPEPKRGKTHWDNVLLEMVWLAKEFQKERRWKLNTAKRVASTAQRSNMDLESRVLIKEQEEEKAKKKLAAWISKEVMQGFWNKAHKVVAFKVKNEVDARKKEVLDRQMDVLLRQTQKYSSLLAERLRGGDAKDAKDAKIEGRQGGPQGHVTVPLESRAASQVPSRAMSGMSGPANASNRRQSRVQKSDLPDGEEEDDSMEYRSGEDDDMDDEATLEEEERLARLEFGGNLDRLLRETMDETKGLEEDADVPLQDLLPKGYRPVSAVVRAGADAGVVKVEDDVLGGGSEAAEVEKSAEIDEMEVEDLEEYRSGEDDDADDEATLEEEERLALLESGT